MNYLQENGELAGIVAGVILGIIFLLLLIVIAIILIVRRRRRHNSSRSQSPVSDSSADLKQTSSAVWSTRASGHPLSGGGRYDGNWSKVIHDSRQQQHGHSGGDLSVDTSGTSGTKTMSVVSEDSYQTERDVEHISVSLCPGPSLPETHFSEPEPLTVYHHNMGAMSAPYLDTGYYGTGGVRKPSSVKSADIMATGRDSGVSFLSSRSVAMMSPSRALGS